LAAIPGAAFLCGPHANPLPGTLQGAFGNPGFPCLALDVPSRPGAVRENVPQEVCCVGGCSPLLGVRRQGQQARRVVIRRAYPVNPGLVVNRCGIDAERPGRRPPAKVALRHGKNLAFARFVLRVRGDKQSNPARPDNPD
jgi:hypothetical protein